MSKTKTTAAESGNAETSRNARKTWRTVTKDGSTYLKSPDGMRYYGTPAEVRDACLYPWRRRTLADAIRLYRYMFRQGLYTRDELAAACAECRMKSIQFNAFDRSPNPHMEITEDMRVFIEAAARHKERSATEFIREAIQSAIEAAKYDAGGELPFTRHERAALERDGEDANDERATVAA